MRAVVVMLLGCSSTVLGETFTLLPATPATWVHGQEVRLAIQDATATYTVAPTTTPIQVRMYLSTAVGTCSALAATTTQLWQSDGWARRKSEEATDPVAHAVVTIATPGDQTFQLCWTKDGTTWASVDIGGTTTWTAGVAPTVKVTIEPPVAGQQAIALVDDSGASAVRFSGLSCYTGAAPLGANCAGDMFKVVEYGKPCTPSNAGTAFAGSADNAATWTDAGLKSWAAHATLGGMGIHGFDSSHPLVDGGFPAAAADYAATGWVYFTVPTDTTKEYEICYSQRAVRTAVTSPGTGPAIEQQSVWRKVPVCTTAGACNTWKFQPVAESTKWLMADLTPGTIGDIVFSDAAGDLTTGAHVDTAAAPATGDHQGPQQNWQTTGGDAFKLIGQAELALTATWAGISGSFPKAGCWERAMEADPTPRTNHGGVTEDAANLKPYGSKLLVSDLRAAAATPAGSQSTTWSTVWVPDTGSWYVCYKRAGGYRIAQWNQAPGLTPSSHWSNLNGYAPTDTIFADAPRLMVPGNAYPLLNSATYLPSPIGYTVKDSSAGAYGPLQLTTDAAVTYNFPVGSWDYDGSTAALASLAATAVRLVGSDRACTDAAAPAAQTSKKGGMEECPTKLASIAGTAGCLGTAFAGATLEAPVFYFVMPAAGTYSVCVRQNGMNWNRLATDLTVGAASGMTIAAPEVRPGMDAMFVFQDPSDPRTIGDWTAAVDVVRIVPAAATCDINPGNWDASLADTALSLYCDGQGLGTACTGAANSTATMSVDGLCRAGTTGCGATITAPTGAIPAPFEVVPYDSGDVVVAAASHKIAAFITTPTTAGTYTVCYRRANVSWATQSLVVATEANPYTLVSPATTATLLGGARQTFKVTRAVATFVANFAGKLVMKKGGASGDSIDHCGNPPAGTEVDPLASWTATAAAVVGEADTYTFDLTVPQMDGDYLLCVRTEPNDASRYSWKRLGTYKVTGSGVRWSVETGTAPQHGFAIDVVFTRCSVGPCMYTTNLVFDPTGAEAKLIDPAAAGNCDGTAATGVTVGAMAFSTAGDGPWSTWTEGRAAVTLPSTGLTDKEYKVCMRAAVDGAPLAWFEVAQATGLAGRAPVTGGAGPFSGFFATPATVSSFTINPTFASTGSKPIAGASTVYVEGGAQKTGFKFARHTGAAALTVTDHFKLVHKSLPATWTTQAVATWADVPGASCLDQGVETMMGTGGSCTDGCTRLWADPADGGAFAQFQFPVKPAKFLVCYKSAAAKAWQQVGAEVETVPSRLEYETIASPAAVQFYDSTVKTEGGVEVDNPSWCGSHASCPATGVTKDYIRVVSADLVCMPPASTVQAAEWHPLSPTGAIAKTEATAAGDAFVHNTTAGSRRVCVHKVGFVGHFKPGLMIQVSGRGGGKAYQSVAAAQPALAVAQTPALGFDSGLRFSEFTSDTKAAYETKDVEALKAGGATPMRTMVIGSGEVVDYVVTVPGYENRAVEVVYCPAIATAGDWTGAACATPTAVAPFKVVNVAGCNGADTFGWKADGLVQHAASGKVRFRLRYESGCTGVEFGCGLVFRLRDDPSVRSNAFWVTVMPGAPDGITVNGKLVLPSATETVASCFHGVECQVDLKAVRNGALEYAPATTLGIAVATAPAAAALVTGPAAAAVAASAGWPHHVLKFTPMLTDAATTAATVKFNATFGARWAAIDVPIARLAAPTVSQVRLVSVTPDDRAIAKSKKRTPAPAFEYEVSSGATPAQEEAAQHFTGSVTGSPGVLSARPMSYLEALVPYKVRFVALGSSGPITSGLEAWKVGARFSAGGRPGNILKVMMDKGVATDANLGTGPGMVEALDNVTPVAEDGGWVFHFRVLDNTGCTRDSRCTIQFEFTKDAVTLTAQLTTPVRVVATTTRVTVGSATAAIGTGTSVTVQAVTPTGTGGGYLVDEYHTGNAFALLEGGADGSATRHRARMLKGGAHAKCAYKRAAVPNCPADDMCLVYSYPFASTATGWAAEWTLQTDKACPGCKFTFHTDVGASPESYLGKDAQMGATVVTFEEPADMITCPGPKQVTCYTSGETKKCLPFDLAVSLKTAEAPCFVPDYEVELEVEAATDSQLVVLENGGGKKQMGMDSTATFAGLYFLRTGTDELTDKTKRTIRLTTTRKIFAGEVGAATVATKTYTCSVEVTLNVVAKPVDTDPVLVVGDTAANANAMCATAAPSTGCGDWYATVAGLTTGITFNFKLVKTTIDPATGTGAVVTATERDGVLSVTEVSGVAGTADVIPASASSSPDAGTVMGSTANALTPTTAAVQGTDTYTYGYAAVVFSRTDVAQGVGGTVKVAYATGTPKTPVRKAQFKVCQGTACKVINLWVLPEAAGRKVAIYNDPAPGTNLTVGGGPCGHGTPTDIGMLAVAYDSVAAVTNRFYVYDTALTYGVTVAGGVQLLADKVAGGAGATHVYKNNEVVDGDTVAARLTAFEVTAAASTATHPTGVQFTVVGRAPALAGTTAFTVVASERERAGRAASTPWSATTTDATKRFVDPAAQEFSTWSISDAGVADLSCGDNAELLKLATRRVHYKEYSATPGLGWDYGNTAHVGIPFPIQTVVRTGAAQRATAFPSRDIMVTKEAPYGCNDGGDLKVYTMAPPAPEEVTAGFALRDGAVTGSGFKDTQTTPAATQKGARTVWATFAKPCERCVLRFDLCYGGATGASCLTTPGASDAGPPVGERTKYTKPITVRPASGSVLQIKEQVVPGAAGGGVVEHKIGEVFKLGFESVLEYGTTPAWAMVDATAPARDIYVSTEADAAATNDDLMYGGGGFLVKAGAQGTGCSVAEGTAGTAGLVKVGSTAQAVQFYFARPCHKCKVKVHYKEGSAMASFFLRPYANHVASAADLVVRAKTCGAGWMLAAGAPVAVRSRKPFSVTVLRVDANNFPSWEGDDGTALAKVKGVGNGGGGRLAPMSPGGLNAVAIDGKATVKAMFSMPCFHCELMLGSQAHSMTVLTDATQVLVLPTGGSAGGRTKVFSAAGVDGEWAFEGYAADGRMFRAYTDNGPTPLAFQPRYHQRLVGARNEYAGSVPQPVGTTYTVTPGTGGMASVKTGTATATVKDKPVTANGIPVFGLSTAAAPAGAANGRVAFALKEKPAVGYEVKFSTTGIPHTWFGTDEKPTVTYTVLPSKMGLAPGTCSGTGGLAGSGCAAKLYAAGTVPAAEGAAVDSTYYLATRNSTGEEPAAPPATVGVVCSDAGCAATATASGFKDGVADVAVQYVKAAPTAGASCTCTVTVTAPAALGGGDQAFTATFAPVEWVFASSSNLVLVGAAYHTTEYREVELMLKPKDGTAGWIDGVTLPSAVQVAGDCFHCLGACPPAKKAGGIALKGYFKATCTLDGSSITGLPATTAVTGSASVTVQTPDHSKLLDTHAVMAATLMGGTSVFKGLEHHVAAYGEVAAAVGGASLELQILDSTNATCVGDYHTMVKVKATRTLADGTPQVKELEATARAGVVVVPLALPPTRAHGGWEVRVEEVASPMLNSTAAMAVSMVPLGGAHPIPQKLYLIRVATQMRADVAPAGSKAGYSEKTHWVVNKPFAVRLQMMDAGGVLVDEDGYDVGGKGMALAHPLQIPCQNVDLVAGWLKGTCVSHPAGTFSGACKEAAFPPTCKDDWRVGVTDTTGVAAMRDAPYAKGLWHRQLTYTGSRGLVRVAFHAEPEAEGAAPAPAMLSVIMQQPQDLLLVGAETDSHDISKPFGLVLQLVDADGAAVVEDDTTWVMTVDECERRDSGKVRLGTKDSTKSVVVRGPAKATAKGGRVEFTGYYFTGRCESAKVKVAPEVPAPYLPAGLVYMTNHSEGLVGGSDNKARSLRLGIQMATYATEAAATEFMDKAAREELGSNATAAPFSHVLCAKLKEESGAVGDCSLDSLCAQKAGSPKVCANLTAIGAEAGQRSDRLQQLLAGDDYKVVATVAIDILDGATETVESTLVTAIQEDLAKPDGALRSGTEIFKEATASGVTDVTDATPEPSYGETPEPPPPTTPSPPTPPTTPQPPGPTPGPVDPASTAVPTLAVVLLSTAAALCALL